MTTGTIGSPLLDGFTSQLNFSPGFYRTWNGVDGRTEPYAGGVRTKWNNYQSSVRSRVMYQRGFRFLATFNPGPLNPGDPLQSIEYIPTWGQYSDSTTFTSNEQNKLLSKLLSKVKGHEFNLAVNLGQMKETVGTLSTNLSKLGRSILALKHGDFATAARQLGTSARKRSALKPTDISGRWLELQYGWLPLISDSWEAMKAFHAISEGPRSAIVRASISKPYSHQHSGSPTHFTAISRGKVKRLVQYEMYEEMSVSRQLGVQNPASLIWELVPYSFVVDWFIPFGTYLDNLNQIPSLKGRWLITDVWKKESAADIRWLGVLPNYYSGMYCRQLTGNLSIAESYTKMQRTYSGTPPVVPFPTFNFGGINSSRRFWNAVALASQRFLS